MNSTRDEQRRLKIESYRQYGFIGGFFIGGLIGVMIAGPNFHEWPAVRSVLLILGCGIGLGIFGFVAIAMAYGSTAAGFPVGDSGGSNSDGSDGGGSDGGGGGGGGGGGD